MLVFLSPFFIDFYRLTENLLAEEYKYNVWKCEIFLESGIFIDKYAWCGVGRGVIIHNIMYSNYMLIAGL